MYTYIISRSGSIVHELVLLTISVEVLVVHVVLEAELVERLVAYNGVLVDCRAGRATDKLTVENESVISHVVDCSGGGGDGCVCVADVKGGTVDCSQVCRDVFVT
jgi:hypothetical protein